MISSGIGFYSASNIEQSESNIVIQTTNNIQFPDEKINQFNNRKHYKNKLNFQVGLNSLSSFKRNDEGNIEDKVLTKVEINKSFPNRVNANLIQDQKRHPLNDPSYDNQVSFKKNEIKKKSVASVKRKQTAKNKNIDITDHIRQLQTIVNKLDDKPSKTIKPNKKSFEEVVRNRSNLDKVGYWQTVYSIESKQGKLLYRPRNKARNCDYTRGPCGHHQLTVQALRDIGCKSMQCRKDRLDYNKSLELSKKLLTLNEKRLKKNGLVNLQGYQKYLIHQQGATGIKNIIAATKGKKRAF